MLLLAGLALAAEPTPTLDDVLASVERHYPLLRAEEARLAAAQGLRLGASGIFDPSLAVGGYGKIGPYEQGVVDASVSQATPLYGLSLDVGYRLGLGTFASYDGALDTLDAGAVYADLRLPLLKGGLTDEARTDLTVARLEVDAALAKVDTKRVEAERDARMAWWKWVAAGAKRDVGADALRVAEEAATAITTRVTRGDAAPIEQVDAERVVVERRAKLVELDRDVAAAAWKLGLYLRDDAGQPRELAGVDPAPLARPEASGLPSEDEAVAAALRARPDLAVLAAKRAQVEAKLRLARVGVLPKLDLKAGVEQDFARGDAASEAVVGGDKLEALEVKIGGDLVFPLLLRAGRGKLAEATAQRTAIDEELRFLRDQVAAEVRTARAIALAAHTQARLADDTARLARQLEDATRRRYELGDTDLFQLYLREQSTLKASLDAADAWGAYHAAAAALDAAMGRRAAR